MDRNFINEINKLSLDDKMELYNSLGAEIMKKAYDEDGIWHQVFKVKLIEVSDVMANDYNPNVMPSSLMDLLWLCVSKFGFLFPVITTFDTSVGKYRIIDGFHRYEEFRRNGKKYIAVLDLQIPYHEAIQLTVLMNRIKGFHQVEGMSKLILKLEHFGLEDAEICKNLDMELEEYLRLKQQLGIAHSFRHHDYSKAWVIEKQ